MFKRQDLQAAAIKIPTKAGTRTLRDISTYPTVPAIWPNRATRRAIKQGHESRRSTAWKGFLAQAAVIGTAQGLRTAIKVL